MKKLLLAIAVVAIFIVGFFVFRTEKAGTPAPVFVTPTASVTEESIEDQIVRVISQKNDWEESRVELNVTTIEGNYAKGDVKFKDEMGGGLWFAARVNGVWQIVYDGNGIITCDMLVNYQDFPKNLIPSCYDIEKEALITR